MIQLFKPLIGLLALLMCGGGQYLYAEQDSPVIAAKAGLEMGVGINLGNTYENGIRSIDVNINLAQVSLYAEAGFRNVRIPVTWCDGFAEPLIDEQGGLDTESERFKSLEATVDHALDQGLYVILNTHHEHWLKHHFQGPDTELARRFSAVWTAIATHFADRSHRLMFEVLNEPEGAFGDWNGGLRPDDPHALQRTRTINLIGYRAIRAVPGNEKRIVLVAPNGMGNMSMIDEVYPNAESLPGGGRDPYLMVTLHTYDPWSFCGQDGSNDVYLDEPEPIEALHKEIDSRLEQTARWANTMPVGVHFGEFGVGRIEQSQRDHEIVREYYRYLTRGIIQRGWATSAWDDRGWFAITNDKYGEVPADRWVFAFAEAMLGKREPRGSSR